MIDETPSPSHSPSGLRSLRRALLRLSLCAAVAGWLTTTAAPAQPSAPAPASQPSSAPGSGARAGGPESADPTAELDPGTLLVHAHAAYDAGEYGRAVELYRRLIEAGFASGDLYYDLGNAYLRNGELGRAIASYRRAEARRPRDQDIAANLAFARKSSRDALDPPRPSAVESTLFFWHSGLSRAELTIAVVVLNLLFWGVLALRLYRRAEALRWLAWALLVPLSLLAGSLLLHTVAPREVAVIVPQEAGAHTGPDAGTVVRFKLHAGTEVRVAERRDGWLRVELPDGQQGWIAAEQADVVTF